MKEISLTKGYVAIVDDSDHDFLCQWKWYAQEKHRVWRGTVYAKRQGPRNGKRIVIYMHRLLLDAPAGVEVDFVDGNGLNNCRWNIRLCSKAQNQYSAQKRLNASSVYKGVAWRKREGRWRAVINKSGTAYYLGYYVNEEEAALAYNQAALKLFGEFARVNAVVGA